MLQIWMEPILEFPNFPPDQMLASHISLQCGSLAKRLLRLTETAYFAAGSKVGKSCLDLICFIDLLWDTTKEIDLFIDLLEDAINTTLMNIET